jgi:MFS transporter, FHS family, glucose/mannose:H+ symporter
MGLGETEAGAARLQSLFFGAFLAIRLALVGLSLLLPAFALLAMSLVLATASGLVVLFVSPALGFVAMGAAAGVFFPVFFVAASQQMGDDPRVSAAILGAALGGGILSPVVLGAVMARFGDVALFWVLTVGLGAAALLALAQLAWSGRAAA